MGSAHHDHREAHRPRLTALASPRHRLLRLVAQRAAQPDQGRRVRACGHGKEDPQLRSRPAGTFAPKGHYPPAQGWPVCGPTLGPRKTNHQPQRGCVTKSSTKSKRFRTNTARCSANTAGNGTNDTCGIDATPLGLGLTGWTRSQGSGFAATLGWRMESRWDSAPHRRRCLSVAVETAG